MGLTYYAALYYSLAVGHAAVDAGGTFEALIGFGYFGGPLLGLAARAVVRRRRTRPPRRSGSPGSSPPRCAAGALGPLSGRAPRAPVADRVNAAARAPCAAPGAAAPISRMPRRLDPIVSGASVRSRKRAALVVVEVGEQDGGQRDAAGAQLAQDQDALRLGQARAAGPRRGRPATGAALVDQPLGRRAAEVQVQQQAVRARGGGARALEVGARRRTRSRRRGSG